MIVYTDTPPSPYLKDRLPCHIELTPFTAKLTRSEFWVGQLLMDTPFLLWPGSRMPSNGVVGNIGGWGKRVWKGRALHVAPSRLLAKCFVVGSLGLRLPTSADRVVLLYDVDQLVRSQQ